MSTYHKMSVDDINNTLIPELLHKLQYADHGLPITHVVTIAETLGQLRCMIMFHRIYGVINKLELTQWLINYAAIIDILQKAEIKTNGEEKAVK